MENPRLPELEGPLDGPLQPFDFTIVETEALMEKDALLALCVPRGIILHVSPHPS